ncbi:hypothetical protein ON010_g2449 [Phytophthora cinnamomi]|nr:hypothetical protein ON010_g2449 [Phytophthora cinnamomi]
MKLLSALAIFLFTTSEANANLRPTPRRLQTYTQPSDYVGLMLERVNLERAAQGLPALCRLRSGPCVHDHNNRFSWSPDHHLRSFVWSGCAVSPWIEVGLLPPCAISAYLVLMCWQALVSNPVKSCEHRRHPPPSPQDEESSNTDSVIANAVIAAFAMTWTSWRTSSAATKMLVRRRRSPQDREMPVARPVSDDRHHDQQFASVVVVDVHSDQQHTDESPPLSPAGTTVEPPQPNRELIHEPWQFYNASVGIIQSAETFWTRIKDKMESLEGIANAIVKEDLKSRAWTSLQARFGVMQWSIGKYISYVTLVESLRESGSSERDMMKKALSMYQERHSKLSPSSNLPAQIDTTEEKRQPKGAKAAKRAKLELSMEHHTVGAHETFSRSMTLKVEVLKEPIRVNQAQQRLAEEQALHRMLNDLFTVEPTGPTHAAYIEKRQQRLLRRLNALVNESSQGQAATPRSVMQSESNENAAPASNRCDATDSQSTAPTPDMSFSPSFEPLPAAMPVVLGPITSLTISVTQDSSVTPITSLTLSGTQDSSITPGFPPLAQSSPESASIPDVQNGEDAVDL